MRIGVVGVGLMGHGMALNLLKGGHDVNVIAHRNRAPIEDLLSRGAREARSLEEIARSSDYHSPVPLILEGSWSRRFPH